MNAAEIKTELRQLIENEMDVNVLQAIHTLLLRATLDPELRDKMTSRALKSEDDIKKGRLFTKDEVQKRTDR